MSSNSPIEWTDASWNSIRAQGGGRVDKNGKPMKGWHCEVVSPGCENCYAQTLNTKRIGTGLEYRVTNRDAAGVYLDEKMLLQPLRWKKPRKIFVGSMTDVFGDWVPDEWLDGMFAVMALCPQHTFQVLTKRSGRMREYVTRREGSHIGYDGVRRVGHREDITFNRLLAQYGEGASFAALQNCGQWPLPNVWLGVSVEDQRRADERIPDLLATPAAVRFLSCEPLLGLLDLTKIKTLMFRGAEIVDALTGYTSGLFGEPGPRAGKGINWVITGGESGPGARPMHPKWVRSLRNQCAAAGVAFFFKQWGAYLPAGQMMADGRMWNPGCGSSLRGTKKITGNYLDGVQHLALPA